MVLLDVNTGTQPTEVELFSLLVASNERAELEFDRKPWWKRFLLRVVFGRGFWIARHRDFYPL